MNGAAQSYELMFEMKHLLKDLEEKLCEKKSECVECLIASCESNILNKQRELEEARQQSFVKLNKQILELKELWR